VHLRRFLLPLSLATALALMIAAPASANHNWGRYHWARSSTVTPIDLVVDDSGVANSWRPSTVLSNWNTYGGPISLNSGKNGIDITTTSDSFGFTGWLGLATISIIDRQGHIGSGTVKLNQTYWDANLGLTNDDKQSVYCEELGHTLGLTHNHNRRFDAATTCMNDRLFNLTPNQHDEDELNLIYDHADGFSSFRQTNFLSQKRVRIIVPAP